MEIKDTYNRIAKAYAQKRKDPVEGGWNEFLEVPAIQKLLKPLVGGKHVLDLGCGTGLSAKELRGLGAAPVVGIDPSDEMIKIARNDHPDISFLISGSEKTPFGDGTFDVVASSLVLHYVKDLGPTFREVARVLKPKGSFVFSMHHPFNESLRREKTESGERVEATPYFHNEPYYWRMCEEDIRSFHHTFEDIVNGLAEQGFATRKVIEAHPQKSAQEKFCDYEFSSRYPTFVAFWAERQS